MKKVTKIWQVKFACRETKYVEAMDVDDALQRARDWSQIEFDTEKKQDTNFDEQLFADQYVIEAVILFVETDI